MNRSLMMASAALILTACGVDGPEGLGNTPNRQISVNGEGAMTATPDLAILSFSVRTRASEAGQAFALNGRQMNRVTKALKGEGIEDRDLQTEQIALQPIYKRNDRGSIDRTAIASYEASNSLTVRLRTIESAGTVIDAAVAAGANELRSFRLGFDDPQELQDEARIMAVKNARAKARAMAEAAGAELGHVLTISEGYMSSPEPIRMRSMAMADRAEAAPTPIEAGEQTLKVSVNVVFALED